MNNREETAGQEQKYVWAIRSTLSPTVRQAVVFDSYNETFPVDRSVRKNVRREIAKMSRGEEYSQCIIPQIGWFLGSAPTSVPSVFIANEFLVINKSARDALLTTSSVGEVDLHPFGLLKGPGGPVVGDFFVLCVKNRDSILLPGRSEASIKLTIGPGRYRILGNAENDTIFLRQTHPNERTIWIDSAISDSIFLTGDACDRLAPFLRESNILLVRCIQEA